MKLWSCVWHCCELYCPMWICGVVVQSVDFRSYLIQHGFEELYSVDSSSCEDGFDDCTLWI